MFRVPGCLLGLAACSASAPAVPPLQPADRCSDQALLAFDPGVPVAARGSLPPMAHAGAEQTQNLASLPCREGEKHPDCEARARGEAEKAFAAAVAIEVAVVADETRLVVTVADAEGERELRFASLEEAHELLAERAEAGRPLQVVDTTTEAVPDTTWSAAIAVTMPAVTHRLDIRRAWLRFEPGPDPIAALLALQGRAEGEGFVLDTWKRLDDATIRLEIRCLRPSTEG